MQVFTQSPRMWRPTDHKPEAIERFHEKRREAGIGGVVLGAALAGFALAHAFRTLGALACVAGMGAAPLLIGADALVQVAVAANVRARVFAARDVLSKATFLAGALLVGALAPRVGTGPLLAVEGVVVAAAGVWLARSAYASRAVPSVAPGA